MAPWQRRCAEGQGVMTYAREPDFNGSDYIRELDGPRLARQHERVREFMRDGSWRTLDEIAASTGDPVASISAQLRHLRKARFGGWIIEKQLRSDRSHGLYEYRLLPPLVARVEVLEQQVASLQMSAPRGIPR